MKKLVAILAIVAIFAMVSASFAASLTGTVAKADAKGGALEVKGADGKVVAFKADAKHLEGIKDGAKVTVTYETKDGKNVCSKVEAAK